MDLADAELNIWHVATLDRWHLVRLRAQALREEATLPRYKLQAGGPWNTNQVVQRIKLIMAANDCEARLAGAPIGASWVRPDWRARAMGGIEYLA